jgi:hypothetical protein
MVEFVKPTEAAIQLIAADMRNADVAEVWASHHHTPLDALMKGWVLSDLSVIVECDGVPCTMLGLVVENLMTGAGTPWLLSSNHALKYKREFLLQSPPVIEQMLDVCPRLSNYVHVDNRVSIRWLKWLGFTIETPGPIGINKELFHRFHLERISDNV